MTTTNITLKTDSDKTDIFVGDDFVYSVSTELMNMVPIEGYNQAIGSVLSVIVAEHIIKFGRES